MGEAAGQIAEHHQGPQFFFRASNAAGGPEFLDFLYDPRATFLPNNQFSAAQVILAATMTEGNPGGLNLIDFALPGTPQEAMLAEAAIELLSDDPTRARAARLLGDAVVDRQREQQLN